MQKLENYLLNNPSMLRLVSKTIHKLANVFGFILFCYRSVFIRKLMSPLTKRVEKSLSKKVFDKLKNYKIDVLEHMDKYGFIFSHECDSLLFTSLLGTDSSFPIDIEAARDKDGFWTRRPVDSTGCDTCYPNHSKSSISRDMLVGLLWYIWANNRLDLAEELYQQGEDNDWILGKGAPSRIVFTPGLRSVLANIIHKLGGKHRPYIQELPQFFSKNKGFAAHLDVLVAALRSELNGGADKECYELLRYQTKRQPKNALFRLIYEQYACFNNIESLKLLSDETIFPSDRLPERSDRKEFWIFQRDENDSGWQPDPNSETHPHNVHAGADFIFACFLLKRQWHGR